MSKKFTEKQYRTLIEVQEDQYPSNLFCSAKEYGHSIDYTVSHTDIDLQSFIFLNDLGNEAVSLMNPLTREWAHEQFVDKEKRYVWQSKQETNDGEVKRLYDSAIGITDSFMKKTEPIHEGNLITETEVKKWGYNPEMFDKEEVD